MKKSKQPMKNPSFSHYLAGLIEGDGTFFVPVETRSSKNKKYYPSVQICFHLKDLPLALVIQQRLGFGSLHKVKGKNAYTYTINSLKGLLTISCLINGCMRTPKILDFWRLVDWLNNDQPLLSIDKKGPNEGSLLEDGWLSGFIEAEGHFRVRATWSQFKIECRFELVQSEVDHNNRSSYALLEAISKLLHSSVKTTRPSRPKKELRVTTVNLAGNRALEGYLQRWPLFGAKFRDFRDWCRVLDLFKRGVHKKRELYDWVRCIKEGMNQNRKDFQWDHLKDFYHLGK